MPGYNPNTIVDVYLVTAKTQHDKRQILWRVKLSDAVKICSDPSTGNSQWMLCWTAHEVGNSEYGEFIKDDGRFKDLLNKLGVKIIKSKEKYQP